MQQTSTAYSCINSYFRRYCPLCMDSLAIRHAKAAASIQFAVNLIQDGLSSLLKKAFGLKKPLDLKGCFQMVEKHATKLFPDLIDKHQLIEAMKQATKTRNRYFHQDFDVSRFEHDVECLLKLASLLGLTECREQIMKFTGSAGISGEDWKQLEAEGNEHYKESRWTEAMNCYTKAIRINPTVAALYSNRALCEIRLKKFDLAREDAEEAVKIDPTQIEFYRTLSEVHLNLQLYKKAVEACKEGLKINSKDEVLLEREKNCQAFVVAEIEGRISGESDQVKPVGPTTNWFNHFNRQLADNVSPNDVSPMDMASIQTSLEIIDAHRILKSSRCNCHEEQKALKIFESAARLGSAEGIYNMALMHMGGKAGLPRNRKKHLELCRKAAEQKPYLRIGDSETVFFNIGVSQAENDIGEAYRDGSAVAQDYKMAFEWFLRAAEHGCPAAMTNLGQAFQEGAGCSQNLESARCWYRKAADLGQAEAQFNLGEMLAKGEGGPKDLQTAEELFRAAADQGLPGAHEALQRLQRSRAAGSSASESTFIIRQQAQETVNKALFLLKMSCGAAEARVNQDTSQDGNGPQSINAGGKQLEQTCSAGSNFSAGNACAKCGNVSASLRCSKCKKAYYCDRDCQRLDWKIHKRQCCA